MVRERFAVSEPEKDPAIVLVHFPERLRVVRYQDPNLGGPPLPGAPTPEAQPAAQENPPLPPPPVKPPPPARKTIIIDGPYNLIHALLSVIQARVGLHPSQLSNRS